ncbi:MAG TPA: trypsin-like peptidase domain-containing protein, partial [Amycolatopsis sp.]|nr:trypsin-like peptidase domain-containing protein [Amycolatopsis sp.]
EPYYQQAQYPQPPYPQTGYGPLYEPPRPKRRPLRALTIALGAIGLAVVVGLGIGHLVAPNLGNTGSGNQNFGFTGAPGSSGDASAKTIDANAVAAKVSPALVNVNTELGLQGAAAAGSGIVLTGDGEVLTNNHVVEGATKIRVTDIGDGKTYSASVLGYDRSHDIAVIKLANASGLTTAAIGDSRTVAVGDAIVGLGNAGGKGGDPIAAPGKVTALNQSITASDESSGSSEQLTGLIQVEANIQSGDSGGALANSKGQVVGVDTAASTGYQLSGHRSANAQQGFAIPVDQAIQIAHQIVAGTSSGSVHIGQTAFMGVTVTDANGQGAQIRQVVPGGPAQKAGLSAGDVITALDGKAIDSATALTSTMDTHHPGDRITVTLVDASGAQQQVTVTPITGPVG